MAPKSQAGLITQHTHAVQLPGRTPAVVRAVGRGLSPKGMYLTQADVPASFGASTIKKHHLKALPNPNEYFETRIIEIGFGVEGWKLSKGEWMCRTTASIANPVLTFSVANNVLKRK